MIRSKARVISIINFAKTKLCMVDRWQKLHSLQPNGRKLGYGELLERGGGERALISFSHKLANCVLVCRYFDKTIPPMPLYGTTGRVSHSHFKFFYNALLPCCRYALLSSTFSNRQGVCWIVWQFVLSVSVSLSSYLLGWVWCTCTSKDLVIVLKRFHCIWPDNIN